MSLGASIGRPPERPCIVPVVLPQLLLLALSCAPQLSGRQVSPRLLIDRACCPVVWLCLPFSCVTGGWRYAGTIGGGYWAINTANKWYGELAVRSQPLTYFGAEHILLLSLVLLSAPPVNQHF